LVLTLFVILALGSTSTEEDRVEVESKEPVASVSAQELHKEYDTNEVAADEKYKNKVIIVSGVIDSIGKDIMDEPYVTLRTKNYGGNVWAADVQCMFPEEYGEKLTSLRKGGNIKIKGEVSGVSITSVLIRKCSIVE
jgi:hypothetical protein